MDLPRKAPVNKNIPSFQIEGDALSRGDQRKAKLELVEKDILIKDIDQYFQKEIMSAKDIADSDYTQYWGSKHQKEQYENLKRKDPIFEQFIIKTYGSYENYELANNLTEVSNVFNPYNDYKVDVTIITEDKFYKSDHISPYEIIMESMSGVCTFDYLNVKNKSDRIVGTLYKKLITPNKLNERYNFFSPLMGNRIGVFNLVKQDWSTFYMNRLLRFVRDDTTGLE